MIIYNKTYSQGFAELFLIKEKKIYTFQWTIIGCLLSLEHEDYVPNSKLIVASKFFWDLKHKSSLFLIQVITNSSKFLQLVYLNNL